MANDALEPYYNDALEAARELVTLIKIAQDGDSDPDGHIIRGQVRQTVRDWESKSSQLRTWLLIEVLARSVAATYDDLNDWSQSVLQALAEEAQ